MPFLRGWAHLPAQDRGETAGFVVLTNDRWNHTMSSVGVVPIRSRVMPFDLPFSVPLPNGDAVVASRLVSLDERDPKRSLLGPANGSLDPALLAAVEDKLRDFLQLPQLVKQSPQVLRPLGNASAYAVWGQIYLAGPRIEEERKRRIVVSPSSWNAVSDLATLVRTTTSFDRYGPEFPKIQGGSVRACCGDATTMQLHSVMLNPRDRPVPSTSIMTDMQAIARGLTVAYGLEASLRRVGGEVAPPDRA